MSKKLKALIVDDERLARKELVSMLAEFGNVVIAGEAEDVPSALAEIEKSNPDLIFLDIQMPGKSGFDLLNEVQIDAHIIFVTAFDEYAIRAFEVNALDYLLKPITHERLANAIDRLEFLKESNSEVLKRLSYDDSLFIKLDSHLRFLKISSILSISSAGDYTEVLTSDLKKSLVMKSMVEWENRLPENQFCRIHRSTIINLEHVDRLEEWFNYSYQVYLKEVKKPYLLSRRYVAKLKNKMG